MAKGYPRTARIVLVSPVGQLLGALPPIGVSTPWWPDMQPVVIAVREAYEVEITVLRFLSANCPGMAGGEVTYLAETSADVSAKAWEGKLDEHPLRLPYAKPGGPAAELAWAESIMSRHGYIRTGPALQVKTWNLSSIWRIPAGSETLWLKSVPPFFSHEGALIHAMQGGGVPELVAFETGRLLMREIPGNDGFAALLPALLRMIDLLVARQREWIGREDELLQLGLPDWRAKTLAPRIQAVIAKYSSMCPVEDAVILETFANGLEERFAEIAECGLPITLVHGDFHPGNVRVDGEKLTLIDWGDSGVGHLLLDQSAFLENRAVSHLKPLRRRWADAWKAIYPGSDPERASKLVAPISHARRAVIYDGFLENIEPSEHPYHQSDPVDWLARTAATLQSSSVL